LGNVTFAAYATTDCSASVEASFVAPVNTCYPNLLEPGEYLTITVGNPFGTASSAVAGLLSAAVGVVAAVAAASF